VKDKIIEVLQAKVLRSTKASLAFSETRDALVSRKAQATKEFLKQDPELHSRALEQRMASLYYRMLDEYYVEPAIRMVNSPSKKGQALWKRVPVSCDATGVDPESYMRAQFAFFHKAYGRVPRVYQLATDKARERAISFSGSKVKIMTDKKVSRNLPVIMRQAEKLMQDICRAQGLTREEVYRNLVVPGLMAFPREYLEADPVYKRVKDEL